MTLRFFKMTLATCVLVATGTRGDEPELRKTFEELLPSMSQEPAQQRWQEICWGAGAPGHEADRILACKLMAERLSPATPASTRIWLLKQLERIGRGECAPAIASALGDSDRLVREAAVRALANNPSPLAWDKLRVALKSSGDDSLKIAIANALGYRGEPASVEALRRDDYRNVKDPDVVAAEVRALGKIATPPAIAVLKSALEQTGGQVRLQIGDALAKCGEKLLSEGNTSLARSIAELLYRPNEPARRAGLEILLKTAGEEAPATILQVLARGDPLDSGVAVGFVAGVKTEGIKQLGNGLASLPPAAQVALLGALGGSRDRAALPYVAMAAASRDQSVRTAALAALGGVGDGSTVPLLLKAIQEGGEPASTARHSLETVFADGVDPVLIDIMRKTADRGQRALFIEILDNRRASSAVPALLEEVAGDDANIRRRAISALGNVAGPDDLPGMILGLLRIHDAGERDEAGRAIAAVCSRIADESKQAEPILAQYRRASPAEQIVLLPVLGRIGGRSALSLIRTALSSVDPSQRTAAQHALFNWPDSAVAEDLATLSEATPDKDLKILSVQELARVAVLPGPLSDDAKLALLARGMKQASRNEEKRLILDRAREVHSFAAVRFAAAHFGDPKLASQAIATAVDLLHRDEIRQPSHSEADQILDEVIKLSKDKSLVERAKSFKAAK
jgi:HEAT repeat protein